MRRCSASWRWCGVILRGRPNRTPRSLARLRPSPVLARISSRSQTQARKVARELLKRADTIVKHAQTGTTPPLELARVCKAWARVPAGIANARARSVATPIANREPQKSTAEGRKCGQLFSVEREGGVGGTAAFSVMRRRNKLPKGERALVKLDAAENEVRALKAEGLPRHPCAARVKK